MTRRTSLALIAGAILLAVAWLAATWELPVIAAGGLLHPIRRPVAQLPPAGCRDVAFTGVDVTLRGWRCRAVGERKATLVFLHGVADNRTSAAGMVPRYVNLGFEVIAYDSRAHGGSGGDACTYGYWEKQDLNKVLDTVPAGPIVLLGGSLGAAVALQEAAGDTRVTGVVAAEVFADLRTVARQRAPFFLSEATIERAFATAEARGRFRIDDVSPLDAARRIHVPVLLIHGDQDADTPPDHSRRVLAALGGPKRLILVHGARHNESLQREAVWREIDEWIAALVRNGVGNN